jgi:pimeloyl-ACP methyl ester carboxylesterase
VGVAVTIAWSRPAGATGRTADGSVRSGEHSDEGIEARQGIRGGEIADVEIDGKPSAWSEIEAVRAPGGVELRWRLDGGAGGRAVELPVCAGRGAVVLDGGAVATPDAGPMVVPLSAGEHMLSVHMTVSGYERRIACGEAPRVGTPETVRAGLFRFRFPSPHADAGGGRGVIFLPPAYDARTPGALLVMPHPWNGSIWTYAAYAELLGEAAKRGVVLLFPSGLGNSLYTAPAEDEVLRAIEALKTRVAVDPSRVSIAGASMGGAGATTIGLHSPDRFASVTSFFGDSKYDLATYVKAILRDEAGAHRVNALDVVDNARSVPVWLIHGEDDRVSPIAQSEILARALEQRGFAVHFDRAPGMGHAGALVARFARELVARASEARAPEHPRRVTYRSVCEGDVRAYGVTIARRHAGDAFVDVEGTSDGQVRVHAAENVSAVTLAPGALGVQPGAGVTLEAAAGEVHVAWGAASEGR